MFSANQPHQLSDVIQQPLAMVRVSSLPTIQSTTAPIREIDFESGIGKLTRTAFVPAGMTLNAVQSNHDPAQRRFCRPVAKPKAMAVRCDDAAYGGAGHGKTRSGRCSEDNADGNLQKLRRTEF